MQMRTARAAGAIILLGFVTTATSKPLDTATWLVDLGRDYPRSPQAGLSNADAEITLALMQAASRVDPACADAWRWQYDMLVALDHTDAARDVLGKYVEREPADADAWFEWLDLQTGQLQTAEQRAQFYVEQLRRPGLPAQVTSDLRRRLAEFRWNRGEPDKALAETKAAIQEYPLNFTARQLLEAIRSATASAPANDSRGGTDDLPDKLLEFAASPGDPSLARRIADELMLLNLPEPADRLYAHAIALLRIADPYGDLPAVMTARIASLQVLHRDAEAATLITATSNQWRSLLERAAGKLGPAATAQMALFYTRYELKPEQAEKLARDAVLDAPDSPLARLALGSALRQLNRLDEAKTLLAPLADKSAAAAAEYAQVLAAAGNQAEAHATITRATTQPAAPGDQLVVVQAMDKLGVPVPTSRPAPLEAVQELTRFNWAVLDYPLHPNTYLSLTLEMPQSEMPIGEPWRLTARLKNIGSFPILIGEDWMVAPDLLVMVQTTGDRPRGSGPLHLSFGRTSRLDPGQTAEVTSTIDLGTIRSGMIGTPQATQEVTVVAVLAPTMYVNDKGEQTWAPDIGGVMSQIQFRRPAFTVRGDTMATLFAGMRASDPTTRIASLEQLAMLLAESQAVQSNRLQYTARSIDTAAVQAAILSCAADTDWQVRARLAEVLRWFSLDPKANRVATSLLNDPHWLVRGLTMRALADHYGTTSTPVLTDATKAVLTQAAQADPDEWVRHLAAAIKARITAAATQPAPPTTAPSKP